MLSARPPFREDTIVKTILAHQQKRPQPLPELRPEVPAKLWQVVARLLAKEPAQRYEKPAEVAQVLVPFIKSGAKQDAKGGAALPQSIESPSKGTVFELETSAVKKIPRGLNEQVARVNQPPTQAVDEARKQPEAANVWEALTEGNIASEGTAKREVMSTARGATARKRTSRNRWLIGGGLAIGVLVLALLGIWTKGDRQPIRGSLHPESTTVGKPPPAPVQDAEEKALIDPNPYLFIRFHDYPGDDYLPEPTMRFGILAKDTDSPSRTKKLTFDEHGLSNNTVIRMDGREYFFGQSPGEWVEMQSKLQGEMAGRKRDGLASGWLLPNGKLEVTQEVEIVPGTQSRLLDTCLVRYILKNRDARPHEVGIRLMLDTYIGSNDGVPFAVPFVSELCDTKLRFHTPDEFPDFLQAVENVDLRNPGTVALLQFRVGKSIERPSRVLLSGWPNPDLRRIGIQGTKAQITGWDVPFVSMKERAGNMDADDSAVTMYWNEQTLEPGKSRAVGFTYGLGHGNTRESSGHLFLTAGGRLVPNADFSFMALVHDPKPKETLTLELPTGIEAAGQQMTRTVPAVPPGASRPHSPVTWRLRASQYGKYELTVVSSTGVKQKMHLAIPAHGMFD